MEGFNLIIKQEEDGSAEVFVNGKVGERDYQFLLDTGAAKSSVRNDSYFATFESLGDKKSSGVFAAMKDQLIKIPNISIGPILKENIKVSRINNMGRNHLVGMDVLKDYNFHFYFNEDFVSVNAVNTPRNLLDLQLGKKFHPYIDVNFKGKIASSVWDTGAGITVVDHTFIKENEQYFKEVGSSIGTDATGTSFETPMYIMEGAVIGGERFAPHNVAGVDLSHVNASTEIPMDMILGYSTLRQANWFFDFPNSKWTILKMNVENYNGGLSFE